MAPLAYNPSNLELTAVEYSVAVTGNTLWNPTVGVSDSPNFSDASTKANAVAQCAVLNPLAEESVV